MSLDIVGLAAGYAKREVLHNVSLSSEQGVVGVFGHNGAGKTTLLRAIVGTIRPFSGSIRFGGRDVKDLGEAVAFVPQDENVFGGLTVDENLRVAGRNRRRDEFEAIRRRVYALFPDLEVKQYLKAVTLSGGQKKMLAFSLALFQQPRLLLLDEPSAGLAPLMVERMMDIVRQVADEDKMTIVLVEQNLAAAAPIVNSVVVLRHGTVAHRGAAVDQRSISELWGLTAALT